MLTALVAVLALAGAPAGTNVVCNPTLQATELGDAYSLTITITSDGRIIPGTLDHIQLGTLACGALLYTSATPRERGAIRKLNPTVDFDQMVGIGLQVVLHESEHVALNSTDECLTEKTTQAKVAGLIAQFADPGRVGQAETQATVSDAQLPPRYHGC
jgi:hypothetical protein